jgi:hypothetical protein
MEKSLQNQLNLYKAIETICIQNNRVWDCVPEFRGAFSRFALKVAQLDLLNECIDTPEKYTNIGNKLLNDIETILRQNFDRYFSYIKTKYNELFDAYSKLRFAS